MSDPHSEKDFFIGWSSEMPRSDRRFFLAGGMALMAGTGAIASGLALPQSPPGNGSWDQGAIRDWTGIATAEPYALFRTIDEDGVPKTALLSCLGKCGVEARIGALADTPVTIRGSAIRRGPHLMIAVIDGPGWIRRAEAVTDEVAALVMPDPEFIGDFVLKGEVLDSKCWFGAMRPAFGKVHKACASLCIRGGLPPVFRAVDRSGRKALMMMTDGGGAHTHDLLPFVADAVEISAAAYRFGDMIRLDGPVSAIKRL